jgi:hypothetical protein
MPLQISASMTCKTSGLHTWNERLAAKSRKSIKKHRPVTYTGRGTKALCLPRGVLYFIPSLNEDTSQSVSDLIRYVIIKLCIRSFINGFVAFFVGPCLFFSFFITQTVGLLGRGISSSQSRYLHIGQHKHRNKTHTQTSMSWTKFEPMIPAFERAETLHALDHTVTVIGSLISYQIVFSTYWQYWSACNCPGQGTTYTGS